MRLLAIADKSIDISVLEFTNPDCVVTLGDLDSRFLKQLILACKSKNIPIYGVYGNHDYDSVLSEYAINLHQQKTTIQAKKVEAEFITISGIEGINDHRGQSRVSFGENAQAHEMIYYPTDIVISHAAPVQTPFERTALHSHVGAFKKHLEMSKPKVWLHGHLHETYLAEYAKTIIIGVYGWVLVHHTEASTQIAESSHDPMVLTRRVAASNASKLQWFISKFRLLFSS